MEKQTLSVPPKYPKKGDEWTREDGATFSYLNEVIGWVIVWE